jgi:hypothetical protein
MNPRLILRSALCGLLLSVTACQLVKVDDNESTLGRGSAAFDPYAASASGAIKLSLQMYNGCAILANGQSVAKGNSPIPNYPTQCDDLMVANPTAAPKVPPTGRFELMTDTNYFLNQLTLIDAVVGAHTNPNDMQAPTQWMMTQSRFKNLDWRNLGKRDVHWALTPIPDAWFRETHFGNANWMRSRDDSFLVEVLDSGGTVRQNITYSRSEFLGESDMSNHTVVAHIIENALAPRYPGDSEIRGLPGELGMLAPVDYRTIVRVEMMGSTNPFKSFRVQGLSGDGAIRVTWSLMPNDPFYFPVTFVKPQDVPPTCAKEDGTPTPCGFGVEPRVKLSRPQNGQFYVPGESFDVYLDVRDGDGNRLFVNDMLPSFGQFYRGQSNGLTYSFPTHYSTLAERDIASSFQVVGPIQDMKVWSDVGTTKRPYFSTGGDHYVSFINELAGFPVMSGLMELQWPTRQVQRLPMDAKPGTYAVVVRVTRQFMGERVSGGKVFFFQVGQATPTSYPNAVGNCQICHRGVLSLDNLRHGFSVDHVEACKACHMSNSDQPGRVQEEMHRLHMLSPKYKADKADCRVCHLTRASVLRPSYALCSSCHPSLHGDEYFSVKFVNVGTPNRFGNCAESCHVLKTPSSHILPDN